MDLSTIKAISPVDGRYRKKVESLSLFFSEGALINFRIYVEVEYFIALAEIPLPQLKGITPDDIANIRKISENFTFADAAEVKKIEAKTNHDVKAVEYYLKKQFAKIGLKKYSEFIHFGLTSQDINNTAVPLSLYTCLYDNVIPTIENIQTKLTNLAKKWKDVPMLSHTHGQPASPTTMGKEIMVFAERLSVQLKQLTSIPKTAKFGGAVGNFNAHYASYPDIDWNAFADNFLKDKLNLVRQKYTTQIEHYDCMSAYFDGLKRINTILIDLSQDMWQYISREYFRQKINASETGSSTMPHKVNPIDFENAEGNLGISNAILIFMSSKLPISRMQRDLTDSTITRNIGVGIAHALIAYKSIITGLNKVIINKDKMLDELDHNWAVLAEPIQTILRREGYPEPYEALKKLTRTGKHISKEVLWDFVDKLKISDEVKEEIKAITPFNYIGKM
ncbi:MAG: adenylosuccinate lyase [Bacteroidales bacterium]|jgi:adenylosuccinate lyase